MPIRSVSFGTNQPPDAIRQLIHRWLTDEEAENILLRFQKTCIPNRQVLWSGMLREHAQRWADAHGFQTLTTALGPLLYRGDLKCPLRQKSLGYIHGASVIFAWFASHGDLVTVLSHPPRLLFHPSGQTFYQLYEEPIIKGRMGNRPVGRLDTAHPAIKTASDFTYEIWPYDNSSLWIKTFGIPDIEFEWRKTKIAKPKIPVNIHGQPVATSRSIPSLALNSTEAIEPPNKPVAYAKDVVVKVGQKEKKEASSATDNEGGETITKKLLKCDTWMGKQPLVNTVVTSNEKSVRRSKRRRKKKREVVATQAQLNTKQGQKKTENGDNDEN
jgi:hypothetical protein